MPREVRLCGAPDFGHQLAVLEAGYDLREGRGQVHSGGHLSSQSALEGTRLFDAADAKTQLDRGHPERDEAREHVVGEHGELVRPDVSGDEHEQLAALELQRDGLLGDAMAHRADPHLT